MTAAVMIAERLLPGDAMALPFFARR